MPERSPLFYIVFVKDQGDAGRRILDATKRPWTAPKDAKPGDVALFYVAKPYSMIRAIGRTDTLAQEGVPGNWTTSEKGFFARYADIELLPQPLTLQKIRTRFPTWARWNNLRGVRIHIVPMDYRRPLAKIIADDNPSARALLSPWLPAGMAVPKPDDHTFERELVTVRRRLRDSDFGKRVRKRSKGQCCACSSGTDYEKLGILEASHIRSVQSGGSDELSNALALCPNHHALFDEGIWTTDGKTIILCEGIPEGIKRTFGRTLNCKWRVGADEVEWHRQNVFNKGTG